MKKIERIMYWAVPVTIVLAYIANSYLPQETWIGLSLFFFIGHRVSNWWIKTS